EQAAVAWYEWAPKQWGMALFPPEAGACPMPNGANPIELRVALVDTLDHRVDAFRRMLPERPREVRLTDAGDGRFVLTTVREEARGDVVLSIDVLGRAGVERSWVLPMVYPNARLWIAAARDE